jgi:hypothetical protein
MALGREGVPEVRPDDAAPSRYQNVQPTAAQEMRRFGATLTATGEHFNKVAADNAFNEFQKGINKLLYGDPGMSVEPGQPQDLGYLSTAGRTALDRRPDVNSQIEDLQKGLYENLAMGEQRDAFDTAASAYKSTVFGKISTHADGQSKVWYETVNSASATNAMTRIAQDPLNPTAFASATADLINARVKSAEILGAVPGDEVWNATVAGAKTDALVTQLKAIGTTDPSRALKMLEKNRDIAGQSYDELHAALDDAAARQDGLTAGQAAIDEADAKASEAMASSYLNPALPIYAQTAEAMPGGFSAAGLARVVKLESAGRVDAKNGKHIGLGQFSPETAAEVGLTNREHGDASIRGIQK